MTDRDEQVIEEASRAGLDEASREGAEALRKDVQEAEQGASGGKTATMAVIIGASSLLGFGAVAAVAGLVFYRCFGGGGSGEAAPGEAAEGAAAEGAEGAEGAAAPGEAGGEGEGEGSDTAGAGGPRLSSSRMAF